MSFIDDSLKRLKEEEERKRRERAVELARSSNSKSTNSSTTSQKSSYGAQTGSQSPSGVDKLFNSTARKYTGASSSSVDDRRSGRYRMSRNERSTYANSDQKSEESKAEKVLKGAGKQWFGGQIASVGTTAQELETTANSYNKAKAEADNPYYGLRSREEAEKRQNLYQKRLGVKEGVDVKNAERVYEYDPNSFSQKAIKAGDKLIESGSKDIEEAKEGTGALGRLAIDLGANALQMAGDYSLAFVPVVGQALSFGSLMNRAGGTASYEARQIGLNPDQQFTYQQGTALIEGLSERIFNSVSAFQSAYGKGAFNLADKVGTKVASSQIVKDFLKSENGRIVAYNLAKLGASAFEEGTEELIADLTEPALKYALTHSPEQEGVGGFAKGTSTAFLNTEDTWQGSVKNMIYDFMVGALMAGIPGSVDFVRNTHAEISSQAFADGQAYADAKIQQAQVQGREGQAPTNAEILGQQLQEQRDKGLSILPGQVKQLEREVSNASEQNARTFETQSRVKEEQAVEEGKIAKPSGTAIEENQYNRRISTVEQESTDRARETMGEGASELSVGAVGRVVAGTATVDDHDTILSDSKAKEAVEELTGVKLSAKNSTARVELEDLTSMNEIANKGKIRSEVQTNFAKAIAEEKDNMSKRGGQLFADNYDEAVKKIGSGVVYESVFTRLYSNGLVKTADFKEAYDRIVAPLGDQVTSFFTEDFARRVFDEGRASALAETAKAVAKNRADSEIGLSYKDNTEGKLDPKTAKLLEKFAKRTKVPIVLYEDKENNNGYYDPNTDTIYISINSTNKFITVAKHELTHHIKATAPERYKELEDFVFERWYNHDKKAMEDAIRQKQLDYENISPEVAREEIIADASEAFFTDAGAINDAISFSKKLGRAIRDGIRTILDTFLDIQDTDELPYRGYGEFLKELNILKDAERMWAQALDESVNGKRKGKKGSKKSKAEAKEKLDEFLEKHNSKELHEPKKSLKERYDNRNGAITEQQFEFFKNSQAVDTEGRLVRVWHTTGKGGFSVFDRMRSDDHRSFFFSDSFNVSQTYARYADKPIQFVDNPNSYLAMAKYLTQNGDDTLNSDGKIIRYSNKKVPTEYGSTTAEQLRAIAKEADENKAIINDFVIKFSASWGDDYMSLEDFLEGHTPDTGKQRGYYEVYLNLENPLIIDGNGADWFEIPFNTAEGHRNIRDDAYYELKQFETTWSRSGNKIYGMTISVRCGVKDLETGKWENITYIDSYKTTETDAEKAKEDLINKGRSTWEKIGLSDYDYDDIIRTNSHKYPDGHIEEDFEEDGDTMYFDEYGSPMSEDAYNYEYKDTRDLAKIAEEAGHDGVIIRNIYDYDNPALLPWGDDGKSDIYIAFNSNQIKLTSNQNPTKNEDIRYSKKEDQEYMKAVEAGDMEKAKQMVADYAKKMGYNSPLLYSGTNHFGYTKIDPYANGGDGSFWASNREDTSGTYTWLQKSRGISQDISELVGENRDDAYERLNDAVHDFRLLIDETFGEWFIGQQDDSIIHDILGNNVVDEVYDGLVDFVADAYEYREEGNYELDSDYEPEYEDFADWQDNSEEWEKLEEAISLIESANEAYLDAEVALEDDMPDGGIYQLYANTDNMYELDAKGALWNSLRPEGLPKIDRYGVKDAPYKTRDVVEWAKNNGYDGVIFRNIKDNGQYGRTGDADVYAFLNPTAQVKSADPVTYDDNGNVIPLSERFNPENDDIRYSKKVDEEYMDAVKANDMAKAQEIVDQMAKRKGWRPRHTYHGTLAYGFTVFDKAKAHVGGNSGAGFYFSTEEDDSNNHYADEEGADNYFKRVALAEQIWSAGEWLGEPVESYEDAEEIARQELSKEPGTYDVYLKYDKPYIRNYRNSTNIYNDIMADFDPDDYVDRDDYDDEYDYDDAVFQEKADYLYNEIYSAVYSAVSDLRNTYEYVELGHSTTIEDIANKIAESGYDYERLTWDDIEDAISASSMDGVSVLPYAGGSFVYADTELARAIIENFGYDAIEDKEVSTKFGQLSREMATETEHIIVFHANQIKSAEPVTRDDNGEVIPVTERFNTYNEDIRYSRKASNKELANRNDTAVFIKNSPKTNYIGMIFNGKKTEETRARRTLDKFIGKDVMITDGKKVYGTVVFGEPHKYTAEEFHSKEAQKKHRVPVGDEYDIKNGGIKWAYPIESYRKFDKPRTLSDSKDYLGSRQARQVRYSKKSDEDYLDAVNRGDMETAQRMVDEEARRNGYITSEKLYHGTDAQFNVFKAGSWGQYGRGVYFTYSEDVAKDYARDTRTLKDGRVIAVYTKPLKTADWEDLGKVLGIDDVWDYFDYVDELDPEEDLTNFDYHPENVDKLLEAGFDSFEDDGNDGVVIFPDENGGISSKVKSAEPVEYDDNGKVIPLSQRFNDKTDDIRFSKKTEHEPLPKNGDIPKSLEKWAEEVGLYELTKQDIKAPVNVSVRDLRSYWYEFNGRKKEAELMNTVLDRVGDRLTELAGEYKYIGLGDALNATVHYRTDENGNPTSVILTCQVKNAEYEVNYDFTTICKKRAPLQRVLERFIKTEGEHMDTLYDELRLDEDGLYKLRLIMEQAGFEVSCIACFVEQNRYYQQSQAKTVADDWNKAVDEWAKEHNTSVTETFDFANLDINNLPYNEIQKAFERYHELMKGQSPNVANKNKAFIEASPFFRKRMNPSDYASIQGQRAMMAIGEDKKGGTNFYNLLKRGQGDSKQSVPFTAYNGEVALLPDKMKGKSLYDYLISVGGARAQSASDFQIEYVYDYMQLVADLSARGLPMHMYTKVLELAELFGMTGIKINLSAMCDVDNSVDGEHAGLKLVNGKYEYNISEQSVDFDRAVELQNRKGYTKNLGIIMVTLSKEHMLKALGDKNIRYIIGYHSSAMPTVIANASNMDNATDYTKINKTNKLNDKGRALFNEAMEQAKGKTDLEKYKNALRIFDKLIQQDTERTSKEKKRDKPRRGNEYGTYMSAFKGNTADFDVYEDIKTSGDARKTADNYLRYCMENDLIPIYFPFAFHPNYYKCELYDFNMYDNISGKYAPMSPVQNIYPGLDITRGQTDTTKFMNRVSEMMDEQNRENEELEPMYDEVDRRARAELSINVTGNNYIDVDGSGIKHNELEHRADLEEKKRSLKVKEDNPKTIEYQRTIDKLEKRVADLKSEFKLTKGKIADPKQTKTQAGKLLKRHDSNLSIQPDVTKALSDIFTLYKEQGDKAFDDAMEIAERVAVEVVNNISIVHDEGLEDYKAIKEYLRDTPIKITEEMKRNITDYNDFRKKNFGRLKLVNGETGNIDNVYMELSEMFPGQFTEDYINPADQLYHIVDVLDNYAPYYETLDGSTKEMQDYVVEIAYDLMTTASDLTAKKSFADKKNEEKERAVKKAREEALASRDKALSQMRDRYEAKLKASLSEARAETRERIMDRAERKKRINQIANIHKRLLEKLDTPSDTKHLPDGYAPIVSHVLHMFDFTTSRMEKWAERYGEPSKRYKYLLELRKRLEEMSKEESDIEIDPDLIDIVDELTADLGENEQLNKLDTDTLEDVYTLFKAFEHQINTFNKRFVEGINQSIAETADKVFAEMDEAKRGKWRTGVMGRVFTSNLNPSDFFTMMGGTVEELYDETRKGFDKYVENLSKSMDFMKGQVNAKTSDKWANHKATYKTTDGESVELTDTQLMTLYCLTKREQAVGHIFGQGIVSAPVKVKKGLSAKQLNETRVLPSIEDVTDWLKNLSKEQIKVAEAIQKFFVDETSAWGNETSMKLYGYKKFTEKHYFPIQSSQDYLQSNFDAKGNDPTLKNISPTKALTRGANNPIVIDDIFSVFAKHTSQMASYNAYVPAITDFTRVWNYKTEAPNGRKTAVKEIFKRTYGDNIYKYVDQFFKDLNGVYKSNLDITAPDKLFSAFKKSAVGGNIRVLLQQPMAIARASLIINPAYLSACVPKTAFQARKIYKEMLEHCKIAQWKTWGFYSMDITGGARDLRNVILGKESKLDKVFMDMYGTADNITWTVIFNACKMQVEAQNKGIEKGSDEYWEKVSALASKVFDRTQVVDSPFHRSEIMKSKDLGFKMMTMFMAEPTKTINMINTELTLAMRELMNKKPGRATAILTRVTAVTIANAMLLAVGQSLVDAMRSAGGDGDDDEEQGTFEERFQKFWMKNTKDNLNIANMLPLIKDIFSLANNYSVTRPDLAGIERIVKAVNKVKKRYESPETSKFTQGEVWTNLALQLTYVMGVPISNAKRDIESMILTGMELAGDYRGAFVKAKLTYSLSEGSYARYVFADMYYDALERGDRNLAREIYSYMKSKGVTDKYIDGRKKTWEKHRHGEDED